MMPGMRRHLQAVRAGHTLPPGPRYIDPERLPRTAEAAFQLMQGQEAALILKSGTVIQGLIELTASSLVAGRESR